MSRPLIAIVGRPNVGKSTLFNRLVGEPRAIVEDVPGTTRDRVYAEFSWEGRDLTLVDTGGLEVRPTSDMAQRVKDQVEVALQEADVIVVVGDGVDGVTLGDREVADLLRRSTKPVVLAVNKADNETRRAQALEFYELALGEPMPVSGYHGRGLEELMDRVLELLPPPSTPVAEAKGMKVAIVGRPNVGKSQLLNSLLGQERAIVSDMPGTTRDALDTPCTFDGQTALLIDTAGLRRKGRIEQGVERYSVIRALRAIDRADVALLVIEATDPVTAQDAHIAGYVRDAFKGMVVVVNKWDLAKELELDMEECTLLVRQRLKFWPQVPVLFVSALRGRGIKKVLPAARNVYLERTKRLSTAVLNRLVRQAVSSRPPPTVGGRRLHILYVTQAEVNPPTFVFFVNDPKLLHFSYQRYLENRLRDVFSFAGTSLRLIFRRREGKEP